MVDNAKKLKPNLGSLIPSKTKTKEPEEEKEQKWWLIQMNKLLKIRKGCKGIKSNLKDNSIMFILLRKCYVDRSIEFLEN